MRQFDPNERRALEAAAKEAGFRLEPSDYDYFAMIENAKHDTTEELLSGEPIMFGRFAVGGKLGYQSVSFTERDGRELAQVKDKDGKVIAEHRAQIMVARHPTAPSPFIVIGGPPCWLEIRERDMAVYKFKAAVAVIPLPGRHAANLTSSTEMGAVTRTGRERLAPFLHVPGVLSANPKLANAHHWRSSETIRNLCREIATDLPNGIGPEASSESQRFSIHQLHCDVGRAVFMPGSNNQSQRCWGDSAIEARASCTKR